MIAREREREELKRRTLDRRPPNPQELSVEELTAMATAATQLVMDQEEAAVIPDVRFLARLVLVREEVFGTMEEAAPGSTRRERYSEVGVPRLVAGLINQLATKDDSARCRAQMYR